PHVDLRSKGVFIGLNTRTTHAEIIRSMIEGLDYQMLDIVTTMEAGTGNKATEIIAVGGAIRNSFWMQNKADVCGLDVHVPDVEAATVLGAAILAGIGAGLYRDADDAYNHVIKPKITYVPNRELTSFYSKLFAIYRDIYPTVAPLHLRLSANERIS
ncbi:MAG: FGGY-family carbohydrate kinase, partial [Thermoguttaceae bacterium]